MTIEGKKESPPGGPSPLRGLVYLLLLILFGPLLLLGFARYLLWLYEVFF